MTAPHTRAPRSRSVASEIDEHTQLGEVYMVSLMRSQLRLALTVVLVLCGTVGLLPLLFDLFPRLRAAQVLGIPLAWVVLGVLVYPFLLALAWIYVRGAERNEAAFQELVARSGEGSNEAER